MATFRGRVEREVLRSVWTRVCRKGRAGGFLHGSMEQDLSSWTLCPSKPCLMIDSSWRPLSYFQTVTLIPVVNCGQTLAVERRSSYMILAIVNGNRLINAQECAVFLGTNGTVHCGITFSSKKNQKKEQESRRNYRQKEKRKRKIWKLPVETSERKLSVKCVFFP